VCRLGEVKKCAGWGKLKKCADLGEVKLLRKNPSKKGRGSGPAPPGEPRLTQVQQGHLKVQGKGEAEVEPKVQKGTLVHTALGNPLITLYIRCLARGRLHLFKLGPATPGVSASAESAHGRKILRLGSPHAASFFSLWSN